MIDTYAERAARWSRETERHAQDFARLIALCAPGEDARAAAYLCQSAFESATAAAEFAATTARHASAKGRFTATLRDDAHRAAIAARRAADALASMIAALPIVGEEETPPTAP